ncbi:MAG: non-ribosomal peptide synthetase, partial [Segetibacter sp.]
AFKVLLHRYTGQQDICVGSAITGRQHQEVEGLVGFFINSLALRTEVTSSSSFKALLQQVKATTMEAYEHQEVPFEKVVEAVVKERDMSRTPLFQVMFVLQNMPEVAAINLGEVQLSHEAFASDKAKFELTFSITSTVEGLQVFVEYSSDLYNENTIERMFSHYNQVLNAVVEDRDAEVGALALVSNEELQLIETFNNKRDSYPKDTTVVKLFEEQVSKTPDATAVVFEDQQLTYQQLNYKANQLAHHLVSKGVTAETLVPICLERSLGMITGILAILKAGGAYVPIDPENPEARIHYILEDVGAKVAISNKESVKKVSAISSIDYINFESDWSKISTYPVSNLGVKITPDNLAYVIYTSGSTGKPKGVMVEHRSYINIHSAYHQ